jgi:predicted ATPase
MAPRIRQIQIQNYKSIERAVVNLEPFTVLVGPNGAGKSNFLDALAFVQEVLSNGIESASRPRGSSLFFSRWMLTHREVHVGFRFLIDLGGGGEADYAFEISRRSVERFRIVRERCTVRQPGGKSWQFEIAEGEFLHPIPGIRPKLEPDRLALFIASATEELRPVYDFLSAMRVYAIDPLRMIAEDQDPGEVLEPRGANAAAVLRLLEESSPEVFERINRLLGQAVPGAGSVRTRKQGQRVSLDFYKDLEGAEPTQFYTIDMSDGTLRILGLLLALYQPWHPSLVAIEEPEATVHPAAAELIIQILLDAAQDRQVLISTHSPDVLDAKELSDSQIRVVTMEKGRTVIAPLSSASRQAIRERLYTPGELLRINELSQDIEAAQEAAQMVDLFTEIPSGS